MRDRGYTQQLTKEQKTGFVLLLVFGLLGVGMGFLQMRNTIYNPFVLKRSVVTENRPVVVDEHAQLQAIDTDQDGLNNYEELFFYETSPYLPDTDSDGIGDAEEVAAGGDPNCPVGKVCTVETEEALVTTSTFELQLPTANTALDILGEANMIAQPTAQAPVTDDVTEALTNPEELRALLLQSGQLSQEQLSQIDDATLLDIVSELLEEQQIELPSAAVAPEAEAPVAE